MLWWLLLACDPVLDDAYLGEPYFTLAGDVVLTDLDAELDETADLGIFYLQGEGETPKLITAGIVTEAAFPSSYLVDFYLPPPEDAFHEPPTDDGKNELVTMATVAVFEDLDGDGGLTLGEERLLGVAVETGLRWNGDDQRYVLVNNDSCGNGTTDADPLDVDIAIGSVCTVLLDPDCDGDLQEWGAFCSERPPP